MKIVESGFEVVLKLRRKATTAMNIGKKKELKILTLKDTKEEHDTNLS